MRAERARLSRHAETAPDQQCRRAGAARDRNRPQGLAVRRLRRGGERAASTLTLIETARLNGIDPQAWLADALRRIADHPVSRLNQLLAGIGKTAPIKLLLLDRLSRRGTQRMPTPVQRLGRLHRLLIRAHAQRLPEADSSCQ